MTFTSTYLANLIVNFLYGGAAIEAAIPATIYAKCYTVAPTAAGGGTEWTDAGISRVAVTRNTTNFPTGTGGAVSNATALNFGTPVGGATVVGIGWMDAASGGNLLMYGDLDAPKVALAGVAFTLPIGGFVGEQE